MNRNAPCPCGSGRKYKKCCMGRAGAARAARPRRATPARQTGHLALLRTARELVREGRLKAARGAFQRVLERRPGDAEALHGLGVLAGRLNQAEKAIDYMRLAIEADRSNATYHAVLAELLLSQGRLEDAERIVRRGLELDPGNTDVQLAAASWHEGLHRFDEARSHLAKALSTGSTSPQVRLAMAVVERRSGDVEAARRRLEGIVGEATQPDVLGHAYKELGFVLDKLGAFDDAFAMFELGGRHMSRTAEAKAFDRDGWFRHIDACLATVTPELLRRRPAGSFGDEHPVPVFLVGFPRSGTTLTEQILAAHPGVVTGDEQPILTEPKRRMRAAFAGEDQVAALAKLDADAIRELRAAYWDKAHELAPEPIAGKVFVDKLPLNILDAALINLLFPEARLLVALRDPRDCCLSCFMQEFRLNTAMVNFLSWERTAEFYARTMGYWLHVRGMLSAKHLEIRYEDTVTDLETQAARLLEFLGVGFDDSVLRHHEKAATRMITTPSAAAVSEPVHRKAVARWRNYEKHVERIRPTLEPFLEAFGYA